MPALHYTGLKYSSFVQYRSSINILVMYRKRSSEETDTGTSSISEDFDKPPQKKRLSVSLIIYFGCRSIFDMERHCVLALSKITWRTVALCIYSKIPMYMYLLKLHILFE